MARGWKTWPGKDQQVMRNLAMDQEERKKLNWPPMNADERRWDSSGFKQQ
jgi:hypothetical protein